MSKAKRIGSVLIIIGLFVPSVLYPLASSTQDAVMMQIVLAYKGQGYTPRWNELEIVLKKGVWISEDSAGHYENRIALPYRYVISAGITALFIGISFIALSSKPRIKQHEGRKESA